MARCFRFEVMTPLWVCLQGRSVHREDFFSWAWRELSEQGLQGIHEGTLLSEEAAEQGLATESWTVDSAEAPRERDWVSGMATERAEFYFETEAGARAAAERVREATGLDVGVVQGLEDQDWDAQWKASFLGSPDGVVVPPHWRIIPPWREAALPGEVALKINPGAGFGTGTHETTQLCLTAIAECPGSERALDFGSGSGILAVAMALQGARVDAVEIDPLAIENARENEKLNGLSDRIQWALRLEDLLSSPESGYPVVVANILRPVLLQFRDALVDRVAEAGTLILSGLVQDDVERIVEAFGEAFRTSKKAAHHEVRALGEWRAVIWKA